MPTITPANAQTDQLLAGMPDFVQRATRASAPLPPQHGMDIARERRESTSFEDFVPVDLSDYTD
jgi:hypothetical protein